MDPRRCTPRRAGARWGSGAGRLACLAALGGGLAALPAVAAPAGGLVCEDTVALRRPDFVQPVAVAAGPLGRLYIADVGRASVVRLDAGGRILFEFETPPHQAGLQAVDLAVTGFKVYVLDAQSSALLRFTDQGSFLDVLQSFHDQGHDLPRALAVDGTGRVLLADTARHQVQLLDETQHPEALVGAFGNRPGELARPIGVAFAPNGSFYVSDTGNGRVQRFSGVGNFEAALQDSLAEPRGLAVSASGDLFVADASRRSVHLFAPSGAHRAEVAFPGYMPTDVAVVGDTLWVLSTEPAALLRLRVLRGG